MSMVKCNNKGFTLIEVLVASTIFMFVAVMAIGIFVQSNRLTERVDTDREVQQAARFAFEQLARSIRHASLVSTTGNAQCPANFIVPKTVRSGSSTPQRICSEILTATSKNGTETYGPVSSADGSYRCLARVAGSSVVPATTDACLTPKTVTLVSPNSADPLELSGFLVSGYFREPSEIDQKPFIKMRATFRGTQPVSQGTPTKQYSFETTLVPRNFEKQY